MKPIKTAIAIARAALTSDTKIVFCIAALELLWIIRAVIILIER